MVKFWGRKSRKSDLPLEPCPWLVYTYGQHMKDQLFCSLTQPHKIYHKRIPQLSGDSNIVSHSLGWFLVFQEDDDTHLSLWNPTISHSLIHLPPLSLKPTQKISHYFLSSSPGDSNCRVILFENVFRRIILIQPEARQWIEIPYAKLISSFAKETDAYLRECVSCNGKIYCFTHYHLLSIDVDEANNVLIEPLCQIPCTRTKITLATIGYRFKDRLVECCGELIYVFVVFGGSNYDQLTEVQVFKLDFERMVWETTESLMSYAVFLDGVGASCCPTFGNGVERDSIYFTSFISSEEKGLYSFNVKDGCLSVSLPCPRVPTPWISTTLVPHDVWFIHTQMQIECNSTLLGNDEQGEEIDDDEDNTVEEAQNDQKTRFCDLPLDCIMSIADCLSLLDYLNFRVVCRDCRFAVPMIQSRSQALQRLKTRPSSTSMWLLLPSNDMAAFKYIDPVNGTSFLMSLPKSLKGNVIRYSRNGWLLMSDGKSCLSFFNPFTEEIIELPTLPDIACSYGMTFSTLPTSPDCLVVGYCYFPPIQNDGPQLSLIVARMRGNKEWEGEHAALNSIFWLNNGPIFFEGSFYLLGLEGNLLTLNLKEEEGEEQVDYQGDEWILSCNVLRKPKVPCRSFYQNYLLECDGKLMSIFVGGTGKWLQVFSMDFTRMRWEKVESLGNNVIYVSRSSCVSAKARIMGTENRIYFARFCGTSILYYSLETKRFHLDGQDTVESFYNTKEPLLATWIEPLYS